MIQREEKSFELVNEKLQLFISYLDISIQSHITYIYYDSTFQSINIRSYILLINILLKIHSIIKL